MINLTESSMDSKLAFAADSPLKGTLHQSDVFSIGREVCPFEFFDLILGKLKQLFSTGAA